MGFRQSAANIGAHGVQHVPARQIECRGELGLSHRLVMALQLHQLVQGKPQLHPGKGVDSIVDAAVAGIKAAQQGTVGRVDDRVTA